MQVKTISLADICPSSLNPRKTFDQESLKELAENIKENGLIQPITIRKAPKESGKKYEIVCGERRYRASLLAGLEEIQAIVRTDLDDKQAFAAMIIENLQRKDVDPIEEAAAFSKLTKDKTMKVKEIAKMLGKSSSYVISRINLSNITQGYIDLMRNGTLYLVHLLDICKLTKEQQETLFTEKFAPECIERWTRKILPMDVLHEWIDECVMKYLDTARFSLLDESFSCGKNCEGCPLNTKNKPEEYNESRDRCMNPSCFNKKTQEFIFREAKQSGLPCIYKGQDCEEFIKAAHDAGIELLLYVIQMACIVSDRLCLHFSELDRFEVLVVRLHGRELRIRFCLVDIKICDVLLVACGIDRTFYLAEGPDRPGNIDPLAIAMVGALRA